MRNIDYVNKKKAKELNIPLDIVTKVNDFYWKRLKDEMRQLEKPAFYIKEIGTLEVSNYKIQRRIESLRRFIKNIRGSFKYSQERKEQIIRDYKIQYSKLLRMRDKVTDILNFKKTYRLNNVENSNISQTASESI